MGLFNTTIQTLSEMAIQESGIEVPRVTAPALVDEFKAELDMMPSLTEEEMKIPADAVPVRECSRLGRYLIEMEDLSRFMITNNMGSVLEAMDAIANANGVEFSNRNVALVVDEASILQEMDDLGMNIGGSNSNDGNIGTVGLVGKHLDIGKIRRFANSKEVVDTIANKYGIPIVKKNYNIGLVDVKHGDISHNGNRQAVSEETDVQPTKPTDQVLNEKDPGTDTSDTSKSSSNNSKSTNGSTSSVDESIQYLRDIAKGKYDNQLFGEDAGGPIVSNSTAIKNSNTNPNGTPNPQNTDPNKQKPGVFSFKNKQPIGSVTNTQPQSQGTFS